MKVLLVGDAHGNTNFMLHAFVVAEELSVTEIFQLGDFGVWPGLSGEMYLQALDGALERHPGLTLSFLDGNHEDFEQLEQFAADPDRQVGDGRVWVTPRILWCPRGTVLRVAGRDVGFLGGAVSVDRHLRTPYVSWWPQENLTPGDVDRLNVNSGGRLDVLLTHDAPASADLGFDTAYRDGRWPDAAIEESKGTRLLLDEAVAANRPKVVAHGHWHLRHDTETTSGGHTYRVHGLGHENDEALAVLDLNTLTVSAVDL